RALRHTLLPYTTLVRSWRRRKNGEFFPAELVINSGNYVGEKAVTVVIRDVSEQHEVEEELRKSKEKFRQLYQNAPIGIVLMDKRSEEHTSELQSRFDLV